MCGIAAIISKNPAEKILIESLKKLEYRGYDSAGIATKEKNGFAITKTVGKVSNLEQELNNNPKKHLSNIGIAHTRWATHGEVSKINSHPFESENWCLVHNGIIENFEQLKTTYNLKTKSQTDTEVIVQLLEKQKDNTIFSVIDACKKLKGSYSLAILNKNTNKLYFAKNKSPFFVANTKIGVLGASDAVCFSNLTENFYCLNDFEFCEADQNEIKFFDINKNQISKKLLTLPKISSSTDLENFSHYMEKEIFETPEVLKRIYNQYIENNLLSSFPKNFFKNITKIKFASCGTAYHSTLFGAKYFEKILGIESSAYIASEFLEQKLDKNTLCVLVSQSGETADTILALEKAKSKKAKTLAFTNVMHSTIANKADYVLPILAGVEIAVASTKAYVAQILTMMIFAYHFAKPKTKQAFLKKLKKFVNNFKMPQKQVVEKIVNHLENHNISFIIGKGLDYFTACEAALKIKEITYITCFALPAGELKHGTLALIDHTVPLILFSTVKNQIHKAENTFKEIEARGGRTIVLSQYDTINKITLQKVDELFMPIVAIIPIQLASYYLSVKKGINPDKPRNLAKSVTVE